MEKMKYLHLFYLVMILLFSRGVTAGESTIVKKIKVEPTSDVRIINQSGKIVLLGSEVDEITAKLTKIDFDDSCEFNVSQSSSKAEIKVSKDGFWNPRCHADLWIELPRSSKVSVKNGSGEVEITGLDGTVDFVVGSGDLRILSSTIRSLEGKSGSGSVQVHGLQGNSNLVSGSGSISLDYSIVPKNAEVRIKSGSGDATVMLPPNTTVMADFKAGSGRLKNPFGLSSPANVKVSMRSGSGDLTLKEKK